MSVWEVIALLAAGVAAGTINTVVGSGTLITFPTLLAFGIPPVTANVSNSIGLVPGSVTGAIGYRAELGGQRPRLIRLGAASLLGGLVGAVLLLVLPDGAFSAVVPVLIALGVLLVIFQPRLARWVASRSGTRPEGAAIGSEESNGSEAVPREAAWVWPAVFATGVYGGYFGAAQGVLLMGVLGIGLAQDMQRNNAVKNVLAALVNGVAGLLFIVVADVDWLVALLIAIGAIAGGLLGARIGRRLPPLALRAVIVVVGVVALVTFVVT